MKVLLINSVCGVGSTGNIVIDISKELQRSGSHSVIAYGVGKSYRENECEVIRFNFQMGYYWHNFLSRFTDHAGLYSTVQTKYLIKKIKEYNPDIIHLHNLHGYYVNYKILFEFFKEYHRPVIWTLHDCWAFTGHCCHFVSKKCDKWKYGCYRCELLERYPKCYTSGDVEFNYHLKKTLFTALENLTIVTPSEWLAEYVRESFLNKYEIRCIPNGIDTEIFRYRTSEFRKKHNLENKIIVLGVSNVWNSRKGLDDFLELSKCLDDRYQIVIVGLTEKQKTEISENILGISRTTNRIELAELYSAADIFLNLTYEDTYPTVNLEAQACGTPMITYDTGGCKDTLFMKESTCVECGNLIKVKEEICKISEMRREKRVKNTEKISKEKCYKAYIKLYENAIYMER